MGYNLNDLPLTMTLPGGVAEGMSYDASSRLVTQTLAGPASSPATTTLSSAYAYGYNPLNWTTRTTTLSGTDTLVHDAQGRLTSESGPQVVATGGSYKWTYDNNGNLTTQLGDDGYPVTYTYTSAITPNQLQTMVMGDGQPTASYAYDGHGDTTAITDGALLSTHLSYDSQARPTQITKLDHGTPLTVTLTYNPSGQRASSHVVEPGQPTLDQQFTYRGGLLGQVRLTSGTTAYTDTYLYTDAGAPYELLRTTPNGTTSRYWYEVDGRGNVVALTDSTGKVVDRYAYDSWGELTSNDATDETVPQQLRYAGYWYDEKLSWYWLSVRYYDPEIERFLQPDPSEQDGVRTYAYVGDNPIDGSDPSGLASPTPTPTPAPGTPVPCSAYTNHEYCEPTATPTPPPSSGNHGNTSLAATAALVIVGRWMARLEYDRMFAAGRVQLSIRSGVTYVMSPPDPYSFKPQKVGDVYAVFKVPADRLVRTAGHGSGGWYRIATAKTIDGRRAARYGRPLPPKELPKAEDIHYTYENTPDGVKPVDAEGNPVDDPGEGDGSGSDSGGGLPGTDGGIGGSPPREQSIGW